MTTLTILGRRWVQKTYGNTYHTATILIDGNHVHTTKEEYGYGDHYLQTAENWLVENGHIPKNRTVPLRQMCEDADIAYHYSASDVSREKDL